MGNVLMDGSSWQHLNPCVNLNQKNRYTKPPNRMQEEIIQHIQYRKQTTPSMKIFFMSKNKDCIQSSIQYLFPTTSLHQEIQRQKIMLSDTTGMQSAKPRTQQVLQKIQLFQKKSLFSKYTTQSFQQIVRLLFF